MNEPEIETYESVADMVYNFLGNGKDADYKYT